MKGTWHPTNAADDSQGGTYVDARGVSWTVTTAADGSGLLKPLRWTAQSEGPDDARKYLYVTGWTGRAQDALFASVDAYAAAKTSGGAGGLVVLAVIAYLLTRKGR